MQIVSNGNIVKFLEQRAQHIINNKTPLSVSHTNADNEIVVTKGVLMKCSIASSDETQRILTISAINGSGQCLRNTSRIVDLRVG